MLYTVHGYEKQLEIYREAEKTDKAYFVLIDVGGMGIKEERIIDLKNKQVAEGYAASEVIICSVIFWQKAQRSRFN